MCGKTERVRDGVSATRLWRGRPSAIGFQAGAEGEGGGGALACWNQHRHPNQHSGGSAWPKTMCTHTHAHSSAGAHHHHAHRIKYNLFALRAALWGLPSDHPASMANRTQPAYSAVHIKLRIIQSCIYERLQMLIAAQRNVLAGTRKDEHTHTHRRKN